MIKRYIITFAILLFLCTTVLAAQGEDMAAEEECNPRAFVIPLPYKKGNAAPEEVLEGRTFTNKDTVNAPGTMPDRGAMTITPTTADKNIPEGYHNGSGAVVGDLVLRSTNIKSGATIFGIAGDRNVVDTSSANAVAGDILTNKTAYVGGTAITGTMATQTLSATNDTVAAGYYTATTLSAVDGHLNPANIKSDVTIFGVTGTFACPDTLSECSGTCVDTDHDPQNCGDCATACDDFSYCSDGSCAPRGCTTDAHCSIGICVQNICTPTKIVFLSSAKYTGNLGGISGADAKCQGLATAAGLSGTYKAWLSDATSSPAETFNQSEIPYSLIDGTVIALNWDDLVDGDMLAPINMKDGGGDGGTWDDNVWTNTTTAGTLNGTTFADTCEEWTHGDSREYGNTGSSYRKDMEWTEAQQKRICVISRQLYCFEQ